MGIYHQIKRHVQSDEPEQQLFRRLAAEGKATRLYEGDVPIAKSLEGVGLLFLIGEVEPYAVITPKGRRRTSSSQWT